MCVERFKFTLHCSWLMKEYFNFVRDFISRMLMENPAMAVGFNKLYNFIGPKKLFSFAYYDYEISFRSCLLVINTLWTASK